MTTSDLAEALLDLLRPQLNDLIEAKVEERLRVLESPPPEPWLSTAEAASYLGLSPAALRQRAQRGTLPAHKDEGRWIFRRNELDTHFGIASATVRVLNS